MPQTPQTPSAPTTPPSPEPHIVDVSQIGGMSARDVRGLRVKLDDLRNELQDATQRRRTISEQLRSTDSKARPGLEERLGVLDARIVGIEKEITATGEQLRNVPPALLAETAPPGPDEAFHIANQVAGDIVPIVAILSVFVFAPLTIPIARFIWKRAIAPAPRAALNDSATQQRLDQLQQSVDTIAIEVERISEGQRFVTRLLNERSLGAGAAEPARVSNKSAMPSERG